MQNVYRFSETNKGIIRMGSRNSFQPKSSFWTTRTILALSDDRGERYKENSYFEFLEIMKCWKHQSSTKLITTILLSSSF